MLIFCDCVAQESFDSYDDMTFHQVVAHLEEAGDDCVEVPESYVPCENYGPLRDSITAYEPEKVLQALEAYRLKHEPVLQMSPPPTFHSRDVFGAWRGIEGHNNSCYFDVLSMAMFAFHDRFDELFSPEKLKFAHRDDAMLLRLLADLVVRPLRQRMFVPRFAFAAMRRHLSEITKEAHYASCEYMDPSELLMHFDQHLPGGLKCISSYQSNTKLYCDAVISPVNSGRDADLTAQKLLDIHCRETGLCFDRAPRAFFLQMRLEAASEQWSVLPAPRSSRSPLLLTNFAGFFLLPL
jgi:hypothetical protein